VIENFAKIGEISINFAYGRQVTYTLLSMKMWPVIENFAKIGEISVNFAYGRQVTYNLLSMKM